MQPVTPSQEPAPPRDELGRWLVPLAILLLAVAAGVGAVFGHLAGGRAVTQIIGTKEKPTVAGMGRVEVLSRPPGAHVFLDGRLVGVTPVERIDVDPGRHALVVELAGYTPYTGAVAVSAGKAASVEAVLAQGGTGAGGAGGAGVAAGVTGAAGAAGTSDAGTDAQGAAKAARPRPPPPPPRPRRDCGSEYSRCKKHCDDADWNCTTRCPNCGSCVTSQMTWEECDRQCNSCKQSCRQNTDYCVESCKANEENCEASQ